MSARPIPLFDAAVSAHGVAAAAAVLTSGQIAAGPQVAAFEAALSARLAGRPVVTTDDMSAAMALALSLAGVGPGDEVLSTAYTCLSSAAPIANAGAVPRWVDLDPATGGPDLASVAEALQHRPRAIVVYHTAGYPAHLAALRRLCEPHSVAVIEDANTAFGGLDVQGTPVGMAGDLAVLSFYPTRAVNAGEGGAVVVADGDAAARGVRWRRFGIDPARFRDARGEIDAAVDLPEIGVSAAMSNLHAAIGLTSLSTLDERLARVRENAAWMTRALAGSGVSPVALGEGAAPWALLLHVEARDAVLAALKADGIGASMLHDRIDRYSGFVRAAGQAPLPATDRWMQTVLAVPCGWHVGASERERIVKVIEQALR